MRSLLGAFVLSFAFTVFASPLDAQVLQEFTPVPRDSAAQLTLFGDGTVKGVIGQTNNSATTSATGSIGVTYRGPLFIISGLINVLGTADTVASGYGATMLAPASGKAFDSGLLDIRFPTMPHVGDWCATGGGWCTIYRRLGLHGYIGASDSKWATRFSPSNTVTELADVPVLTTGLGINYRFFDGAVAENNRVAMALDLTWATRHIEGDLYDSIALRRSLLNTRSRDFGGFEGGLLLRYNEIYANLTYYAMDNTITGFSHGQIVAAISVQAKLSGGSFTPMGCQRPVTPKDLQAIAVSKTEIKVKWTGVDSLYYELVRKSKSGKVEVITPRTAFHDYNYDDQSVSANQEYH